MSDIDYIVKRAYDMKIGARALRSVMEVGLCEYMFDSPNLKEKTIKISKEFLEGRFNKEKRAA